MSARADAWSAPPDGVAGRFGAGALLGDVSRIARANAVVLGVVWALLLAASTLVDMLEAGSASGAGNLPLSIAGLFAQAIVTRALLAREAGVDPVAPLRILPLLGAQIVTGLGIALGLVLLVVPGLFLFARWSAVTPLLLGEGRAVGDAVGGSWELTRGHALPIALAVAALCLPLLAAGVLAFEFPDSAGTNVVGNALLYATQVADWTLAVAVYGRLAPGRWGLRDVFA